MKEFKSLEEMKEYGKNFGKYQYETVLLNGKKKILCGTDMVYEEGIWSTTYGLIRKMKNKFGILDKDNNAANIASSIRDEVINYFENNFDVEFVDVYDEY